MTNNNKSTYLQQSVEDLIPYNVEDKTPTPKLPKAICKRIDQWILRYPPEQKCSGVFEALRLVQEANGGVLDTALMDAVAQYLDMPNIAVYEIAAFYTMYHLNPVGQHVIDVCTNISCMLNGSEKLLQHLEKRLQIKLNETTKDGQFTLKEVECLGACIAPPVCMIGKKYYVNLTPEKIDEIINSLSKKKNSGIKKSHGE